MIIAIYRHATRELLLADDRRPEQVITVAIDDAAELARAIDAAIAVPAHAERLARP